MGNILIPKIQQIDPVFRSELLQEISLLAEILILKLVVFLPDLEMQE